MKIGVDLDGTVSRTSFYNPGLKLPWFLFLFLIPLILAKPNKKIIEELKKIEADGNEIIIISARPKQATNLTKGWLKRNEVPFKQLFCVGFGKETRQRKLNTIREQGIAAFIDDDERTLRFLEGNDVDVFSVNSVKRQFLNG